MFKRGNKHKNRPSVYSWLKRKRMSAGHNSAAGIPKSWYQCDCLTHGIFKSNIKRAAGCPAC